MMDGEGGTAGRGGGGGRHSLSPVCLVSPVLTARPPPHLSSLSPQLNEHTREGVRLIHASHSLLCFLLHCVVHVLVHGIILLRKDLLL